MIIVLNTGFRLLHIELNKKMWKKRASYMCCNFMLLVGVLGFEEDGCVLSEEMSTFIIVLRKPHDHRLRGIHVYR